MGKFELTKGQTALNLQFEIYDNLLPILQKYTELEDPEMCPDRILGLAMEAFSTTWAEWRVNLTASLITSGD